MEIYEKLLFNDRINVVIYTSFSKNIFIDDIRKQEEECYQFFITNTNWNLLKCYSDDKISNTFVLDRTEIQNILKDSEKEKIHFIIVQDMNILGSNFREYSDFIHYINDKKIFLFVLNGKFDESMPDGNFCCNIMSSVNEYLMNKTSKIFLIFAGKLGETRNISDSYKGRLFSKKLLSNLLSEELKNEQWIEIVSYQTIQLYYEYRCHSNETLEMFRDKIIYELENLEKMIK